MRCHVMEQHFMYPDMKQSDNNKIYIPFFVFSIYSYNVQIIP